MPELKVNYNLSIERNSNHELRIRRSLKDGDKTALVVKEDGLYAEQKPGSGTGGFPDNYRSNNGIQVGITSTISSTSYPKRVVAPDIVHRTFTCTQADGSDISIRPCDIILPGDMFRVLDAENNVYNYYVILKTSGTNVTLASSVVATVPADASCN